MKRKLKKALSGFLCACFVFLGFGVNAIADTKSKPIVSEITAIGDQKTMTPSELKKSFEEEKNKTDKFIIKYKNNISRKKSFNKNDILKNKSYKVKHNEEIVMQGNSENIVNQKDVVIQSVTLEESVDITDFISEELRTNSEIEYIQPDYRFEISELALNNEQTIESSENGQEIDDSVLETPVTEIPLPEPTEIIEEIPEIPYAEELEIENLLPNANEKVIVAIIDTGIDFNHEALKDKIFTNDLEGIDGTDSDGNGYIDDINGWNFVDKNNIIYKKELGLEQAHGTHIAGIISGETKENYGISSDIDVVILPLKVFSNGQAYTSDIIEAIKYAESMGAKIINCSFGSTSFNPALKEAMENSSALFVCAAGNGRKDLDEKPVYPTAFGLKNIISVASVNDDGGMSYFSNYGVEAVEIAAPGRDITSTIPEGEYGAKTGTSMSAAIVSGVAAQIASENAEIDTISIKNQIIDGADKIITLDGYVNQAARLNPEYAISGQTNNEIRYISAIDDFNVTGYSSDSEQMRLFSEAQNIAVASGGYHNLVLKDDGTVWAWGDNTFGQLGNGVIGGYSDIPVQVMELQGIIKIDAGETSSMAFDEYGDVWSWGGNHYGQLGQGHTDNMPFPMRIDIFAQQIRDISMSNHGAVIYDFKGYHLITWGDNRQLQLGEILWFPDEYLLYNPIPTQVTGATDSSCPEIASCGSSSTLLKNVWAGNAIIGNGRITESFFDGNSSLCGEAQFFQNSIESALKISAGNKYNLVWTEGGDILQWENIGVNLNSYSIIDVYEQETSLEYYRPESLPEPIITSNFNNVKRIESTIGNTNLVLLDDGSVLIFGENSNGTFGDGTQFGESNVPALLSADAIFADIDGGCNHVIAVADDGSIWGWGTNSNGVLGGSYDGSYMPMRLFDVDLDNNSFDSARKITSYNDIYIAKGAFLSASDSRYFTITPNRTGTYKFDIDPSYYSSRISLYDSQYQSIGLSETNSDLTANLVEGETYYIKISASGGEEGPVDFTLQIQPITQTVETSAVNLQTSANKDYTLALVGKNISTFNNVIYKIQYDPQKLQLVDFAAQTEALDTSVGKIPDSDIEILTHTNALITFKVNKNIPSGRKWIGTINMLKFKALSSDTTTIKFEQ